MKKFFLLLCLFSTAALAADTSVPCQGASCKVKFVTRDSSNVAVSAGEFDSTGALTVNKTGSGLSTAGADVNVTDATYAGSALTTDTTRAANASFNFIRGQANAVTQYVLDGTGYLILGEGGNASSAAVALRANSSGSSTIVANRNSGSPGIEFQSAGSKVGRILSGASFPFEVEDNAGNQIATITPAGTLSVDGGFTANNGVLIQASPASNGVNGSAGSGGAVMKLFSQAAGTTGTAACAAQGNCGCVDALTDGTDSIAGCASSTGTRAVMCLCSDF